MLQHNHLVWLLTIEKNKRIDLCFNSHAHTEMEQHFGAFELVSWGSWGYLILKKGRKFLFSFTLTEAPLCSVFKLHLEGDSLHERPAFNSDKQKAITISAKD